VVAINKIIKGYEKFYHKFFKQNNKLYKKLVEEGQSPKTLMIACSDSRVDPSILTSAAPGEIFVIRNVANLVPPFQKDKKYHGTSAAIEFAVNIINVENIIILGHTNCAGIRALATLDSNKNKGFSFVIEWMKIASKAWSRVLKEHQEMDEEQKIALCEKESLIVSYENLFTYPWIKSKVDEGKLEILAWHFDLKTGDIISYDPKKDVFDKILR